MCGFFISNELGLPSNLEDIVEENLRFRGPDYSSGIISFKGWHLYHSRLAIISIHDNSAVQPFFDNSGGCLVFNGEILNFKELGVKHFGKEYKSDTQVLSLLISNGMLDLDELDGFFAFCYINSRGELTHCARDKFGVKPLYYYKNGSSISVSSEPSVLKELFNLGVNKSALEEYKSLRAPIFSGSFFSGVDVVSPGECYVNGRYFRVEEHLVGNYQDVPLSELEAAIEKGINSRKVSDARVGLLLSRGIDSNLIRGASDFEQYFSIGFPGDEDVAFLESQNIKELSLVKSTPESYKLKFYELLALRKEPLSVPNEVLLSCIGEKASEAGYKVLLSGEGADEFFAGYDRIFTWAADAVEFDLEEFIDLYSYGHIDRNSSVYLKFQEIFSNVQLPNTFEYVRWFFIKYHMPVLFRRLDFSLMSAGIEGREPLANMHLFEVAVKMGPEQLMFNKLGKLPLRQCAEKVYGKEFAFEKKVGFPVNLKSIFNDTSKRDSYSVWFDKNVEIFNK